MEVAWLHGYTMRSAVFDRLWGLMPGHRHRGIDLPGHGMAADQLITPLPTAAASVAGRLREAGVRTLVGLSYGSCTALQVALDHPDRLDALVLAAPTLAGAGDDPEARAKYLLMRRLYLEGLRGLALTDVWMADPPAIFSGMRAHAAEYERLRRIISLHSFAELATGAMAAIGDTTHTDADLAGLSVPTLVITGTRDLPRFLDNARRLEEASDRVTTHVVHGAGHLPLLERPGDSAVAVAEFLGRVGVGEQAPGGAVVR